MDISVTTPATATSISVALVKASKRIVHSLEDDLIDFWIKVADGYIEKETKTSLMQRTLTLSIGRVLSTFSLPYPPLVSLDSLKYTVDGATETTVDVLTGVTKKTVEMLPQYSITALSTSYDGKMTAVYKAGYATPESVPSELRQASLLLVGHYLTSREAAYMDPRAILVNREIAFGVNQLCRHHIVPNTNEPINGGF